MKTGNTNPKNKKQKTTRRYTITMQRKAALKRKALVYAAHANLKG